MQKIIVFAMLLFLIGCKSTQITADSPEKYIIENLVKVASEKEINKVYPEARITEGTDLFQEGTVKRPYSILYPNTPNEALIIWEDQSKTALFGIMISKEGKWRTKSGIQVGTPYEELVEINNGPISFYGFGWDYSGAVDWNGGKMEDSKIRVFLAPAFTVSNEYYGDEIIEASEEEIEEMQLSVQSILYKEM